MAIYHLSAKLISRGKGRSATAAAAYRGALAISDERTGERHDYSRKGGVLDHALLTPSRAPAWAQESARLWNAAEQFEKRKDAQLCREIVVALPHELTLEQNRALLHAYVREAFVARGMAAQVDIHAPGREGDRRNIHAHILLTTRPITRDGFKDKKPRNWNERATLIAWRDQWARHVNRALQRIKGAGAVDARSFKDQGIADRAPTSHLGPAASEMERRGEQSRIGDENRVAAAFNRLQQDAKIIDLAIEREKRKAAAPARPAPLVDPPAQTAAAEQRAIDAGIAHAKRMEQRKASGATSKRPAPLVDAPAQTAAAEQRAIDAGIAHAKRMEKERRTPAADAAAAREDNEALRPAAPARRPGEDLESWANRLRAEQQSRQIGEQVELERLHDRATLLHEAELEKFYKDGELRTALAAIEARQKSGGLWYRLRQGQRDREQALALRDALAQSAELKREAQRTLAMRLGGDTRELAARHDQERARLDLIILDAQVRATPPAAPAREEPSLWDRVQQMRQAFAERAREGGEERERDFERDR